ncbi:MAG: glycosyltransferase [Comamonadaceae bacterium]|nr:MAG: glycosyltransferase [Comamonadaceae bacterium]
MSAITLFAAGTQGDVRPLVALGVGLREAGHRVRLCSSSEFEPMARAAGLQFAPLSADFRQLMARERATLDRGLNLFRVYAMVKRRLLEMAARWPAEGLAACETADLLIGAGNTALLAASLGEARRLPVVQVQLQPMAPCRDIPPMILPPSRWPLPGAVNLALYRVLRLASWRALSPAYDQVVRPALGLPPYPWRGPDALHGGAPRRTLYGYSDKVLPRSADWGPEICVTGYCVLPEQRWEPPAALRDFLAAGEAPVYIGFGSMAGGDAQRLAQVALDALQRSGRRGVLSTGWGGLALPAGLDPQQVCVIEHAPHEWLFPRMALAVHHGGAGTSAAAARAGIPSVVVPFFGDQPFWADRLRRLGVAPEPLRRKKVDGLALAAAMARASTPGMRKRAAALGASLRSEDGVACAVEQLRSWGLI